MKKRTPHLPRREKLVRQWIANGWHYELTQRPSGSYAVYAMETDGDGWRIESGATVKAALAAIAQPDADVLALAAEAE